MIPHWPTHLRMILSIRPRQFWRALLLLLIAVAAVKCAPPSQEWPGLQQPESPPPEVLNSLLVNRRWQLEVVILDGEPLIFDRYKPVFVLFSKSGGVTIGGTCGHTGFAIAYLHGQRYHIGEGISTAEECGSYGGAICAKFEDEFDRVACEQGQAINRQRYNLERALKATAEYEFTEEDKLILRGDGVAMRLVADCCSPMSPTPQVPQLGAVSDKPPNPAVDSYVQTFGVSVEEAERRLRLQYPMRQVGGRVCEAEPTCAGFWVQHEPVFGLVMAFTLPAAEGAAVAAEHLAGTEIGELVIVVQRPYTLAELREMLRLVTQILQGVEGLGDLIYASGLDIPAGKVNLYSPDPAALREKLIHEQAFVGTGISIDDIEFVFQAQPASPIYGP